MVIGHRESIRLTTMKRNFRGSAKRISCLFSLAATVTFSSLKINDYHTVCVCVCVRVIKLPWNCQRNLVDESKSDAITTNISKGNEKGRRKKHIMLRFLRLVRAITRVVRHSCQLGGGSVVEKPLCFNICFLSFSLPPQLAPFLARSPPTGGGRTR